MTYTTNYSIPLPGYGDTADVQVLNDGTVMIDHLTHGNRTMIAAPWDAETTYMAGDYAVKTDNSTLEADLYKCNADNTTGAWDSTKWTHKTIGEVLEELATSAGAQELDDLSDVEITNPSEGQILRRNANGDWVNTDMPDTSVTKTAEGNPVEFTDGADAPLVKCETAITGSQDLHGYDKPWVGGAGKNKLDLVSITPTKQEQGITFTVNSDGTILANGTATGQCQIVFNIAQSAAQTFANLLFSRGSNVPAGLTYAFELSGSPYTQYLMSDGTISSSIASAPTSVNFIIRMQSGTVLSNVLFEPMLRASGTTADFEPYSNICPITAYTEGEIEVRGKNIAPSSPIARGQYVDGAFQNNNNRICSDYINILPNIIYTASIDRSNAENLAFINYAYFDKNKTYLGDRSTNGESAFSGDKVHTFSVSDSQVAYIRLTIRAYSSAGLDISDKTLDNAQLMFEKGSTPTTYEPYVSTTHTTTYPSAIYRGSEDVVNGEVTNEMPMVDLGDLTWVKHSYSDNNIYYTDPISNIVTPQDNYTVGIIICDSYDKKAWESLFAENVTGIAISNNGRLAIANPNITTLTDFNTHISSVNAVYELATPTTSSVTPTNLPIRTLSGYSHIESSTGDMEIEYIVKAFSPITELVDSQISALQKMMELMLTSARETTMTASTNYTTGTLIVACGALYKATTAISSGASLVVGTNITPTTVAAELAALA